MRSVDSFTATRFTQTAATLCTCWRIIPADREEIGLTDHDQDLSFEGTVFKAQGGADGTAVEQTADLAPDNGDIIGILSNDLMNVADIEAGIYDNARIEVWRVDWRAPAARQLQTVGTLGQIERTRNGYKAECRSLKHLLDQQAGRIYGRTCDAVLGDVRCGVDITDPAYQTSATVTQISGAELEVTGLESYVSGWFRHGQLQIADGDLSGITRAIRDHSVSGAAVIIQLWEALPAGILAGQSVTLTAGCDKRSATCSTKFNNILNFRGYPYIPGSDILTKYPVPSKSTEDVQ